MEKINKPIVMNTYIDDSNNEFSILNYNIDPNNPYAISLGKTFDKDTDSSYNNENLNNIIGVEKVEREDDYYNYFVYGDRSSYIYHSNINSEYIIKIDSDYKNAVSDNYLMTTIKLKQYQNLVNKTVFPVGIVTYGNKVVGQITQGYFEHTPLKTICDNYHLPDNLKAKIFIKVIDILTELSSVGILYGDIHSKNILIKVDDKEEIDVKLIDFDNSLITYYDDINKCQIEMFEKIKSLLPLTMGRYNKIQLNFKEYLNIDDLLNDLNQISNEKII